jgi:glycosyltransferase involved in cell wall biosynthesis
MPITMQIGTLGDTAYPPLVSVVLPAFNAATFICQALESVMQQTYRHLEILVVDDASIDATAAVTTSLAQQDSRIRLLRRETNGGPAAARNAGLAEAEGIYTAFIDSDDEWAPNKLALQMAALAANPGAVLACCNARWVRNRAELGTIYDGCRVDSGPHAWKAMLEDMFVGTPCAVVRTAAARRLCGFDESLQVGEDQDFWLRLAFSGEVVALPDILVRYHLRNDSYMAGHGDLATALWLPRLVQLIESRRTLLSSAEYHRILAAQYWRVGRNLYHDGQWRDGCRLLFKALAHGASPLDVGLYLIRASPPVRRLKAIYR